MKAIKLIGLTKPKDTKRNRLITEAVRKAFKDYGRTFIRLVNKSTKQ